MVARNLDLTALRAFMMVAEAGGVTRAAGLLHLTQSAVSMQIKRLEQSIGRQLFERWGRRLTLTADGELLLGYARQMLELNDQVWSRMTAEEFTGEVRLGVPHDIIYPSIPGVMQTFAAEYPRVQVTLISSYTRALLTDFDKGELDVILTTEEGVCSSGETLRTVPLIWIGAPGGRAWKAQPLSLAFATRCVFRGVAVQALDASGIPWKLRIEAESERTIEATISADLAIQVGIDGATPPTLEPVQHGGALPQLPMFNINMYVANSGLSLPTQALASMIRTRHALASAVA